MPQHNFTPSKQSMVQANLCDFGVDTIPAVCIDWEEYTDHKHSVSRHQIYPISIDDGDIQPLQTIANSSSEPTTHLAMRSHSFTPEDIQQAVQMSSNLDPYQAEDQVKVHPPSCTC